MLTESLSDAMDEVSSSTDAVLDTHTKKSSCLWPSSLQTPLRTPEHNPLLQEQPTACT